MPNYRVRVYNMESGEDESPWVTREIEADLYAIGASGELTFLKLRPLGAGIRPILSLPAPAWQGVEEVEEEQPQNHGLVEG